MDIPVPVPVPVPVTAIKLDFAETDSNGLEDLIDADILLVQRVNTGNGWPSTLPSLSVDHLFSISNPEGQVIFYVAERVAPTCCYPRSYRPFVITFYDKWGRLIAEGERKWKNRLKFWGADIYGNDITVALRTTDEYLGEVRQKFALRDPTFTLYDPDGEEHMRIEGKLSGCWGVCGHFLQVKALDLKTSKWIDKFFVASNTMAAEKGTFGVQFPMEMDSKLKTVLLAFVLNVILTYYESHDQQLVHTGKTVACTCLGRNGCTGLRAVIISFIVTAVLVPCIVAICLLN